MDAEAEETECAGHGGAKEKWRKIGGRWSWVGRIAKVLVFENWILVFLCSFAVGFHIATSLLFISLTRLIFIYFLFSFLFYFGFKILYVDKIYSRVKKQMIDFFFI